MNTVEQRIRLVVDTESDAIQPWLEHFLTDRKVSNLTPGTVNYYREKLTNFLRFCEGQGIENISDLTPQFLRTYFDHLQGGHTPGGVHSFYRSVRAFLFWYEGEVEPENWRNPIRKLKPPKVPEEILEPVELEVLKKLLDTCKTKTFAGSRDYALLMVLADCGLRSQECLSLNREDVDLFEGQIIIKQGKGRKPRQVYLGERGRKALRQYMRKRLDSNPALWINQYGEPLKYGGLRTVLIRLSKKAGVKHYSPHAFRRFYALTSLRNGADIFTLSKSMGHSDLAILRKYLKQTDQDVRECHKRTSPIDNM